MKTKVVNYLQFSVATLLVTVIATLVVNYYHSQNLSNIWKGVIPISYSMATTLLVIFILRSVKFLHPKTWEENQIIGCDVIVASVSFAMGICWSLVVFDEMVIIYLFGFTSVVMGIINIRYNIIAALFFAGAIRICYVESDYFLILLFGFLFIIISLIIKLVFFTKWAKAIKVEEQLN